MTDHPTNSLERPELWARTQRWPRRRRVWLGLVVVYSGVALFWLLDFSNLSLTNRFIVGDNLSLLEARSWLRGRLDLIIDEAAMKFKNPTNRPFDSALFEGRVYSHFPPLASMVFVPIAWLWRDEAPRFVVLALMALIAPALAYRVFLVCTPDVRSAVLMTFALLFGTSLTFVVDRAVRWGYVWHFNQVLSTLGMLIVLAEYFGRRRVWLAGIGLIMAFWSRQLTLAYAMPLLYMAWRWPTREVPAADTCLAAPLPEAEALADAPAARRLARLGVALAACALMVGVVAALNWLKFEHPLQSGYTYIYEGRSDGFAKDAKHGIFSSYFIPRNLFWINLGPPQSLQVGGLYLRRVESGTLSGAWQYGYNPRYRRASFAYHRANTICTGIWWTTPLLFCLFVDARRIWRDPARRVLLLAVMLVFAAQMSYHSIGQDQRGYNRYSPDYLSPLLAILAPYACQVRRRWVTLALVGWSILYFQWLTPQLSSF